MKLTDPALEALARQSALEKTDVFFCLPALPSAGEIARFSGDIRERAFVFLPGGGFPRSGDGVCAVGDPVSPLPDAPVLVSDIRLLSHPDAPDFLERSGIKEYILPFYECADPASYGYRFSYRYIAELRAALPFPVHITGISVNEELTDRVFRALGVRDFCQVGAPADVTLTRFRATGERAKLYETAAACEKYPLEKRIVFCPTRAAARSLAAVLFRRNTPFGLFHGGRTPEQNASALEAYIGGRTPLLIATKALFASFCFLTADRVLSCGVPFSLPHARSLALLSPAASLHCVYCEEDVRLNVRLIDGFTRTALPDVPPAAGLRLRAFLDLLRAFSANEK